MSAKRDSLIELKGAMLPVLSVILRSQEPAKLREEAQRMFGGEGFFDGDPAALDFSQLESAVSPDWTALVALFAGYGLRVIGIRNGSAALAASAAAAGLPLLPVTDPGGRYAPAPAPAPAVEVAPAPVEPPRAPAAEPPSPPAPLATLLVDKPLRSGQRVYARGGDVVVLAVVSAGAEVIADGSIHVYAPLRGRALAGASGDARARIFTTRMEAELVSIAGLYRTFEDGVPAGLAGKPAQIRLVDESPDGKQRLAVEPLSIG